MNDLLENNKEIIEEFQIWKEQKEYEGNLDQIAGNATAPIGTMYGKIQTQNYQLGKDLQSNLGSPKTKHGEAAEKLEIRARNKNHILKNEEASSRSETNRIHKQIDIYDGNDAYQVKFNKTPADVLRDLTCEENDYRGVKKIVPKEHYDELIELANKEAAKCEQKALECKKNGDLENYNKYKEKASKCRDVAKTTEASKVSRNDAIKASKHPTATAMKFVVGDAIEAGAKAGATAAVVSGVITGVVNVFEVIDGNKTFNEAAGDTVKAMGKAGVVGAAYGMSTSLIQGTAGVVATKVTNEAAKQVLNGVANSNAVTYVLVATVEFSKTLKLYFDNKIDKKEMMVRIGDTTFAMAGSIVGGIVGSAFGPVGTIVGGTLGYLATTAFYHGVIEVVQLKSMAKEYERIIPLLQEAQEEMIKARENFEKICQQYRLARYEKVSTAMDMMENSIANDDMNKFLMGLNTIMAYYGESVLYTDFEKFDEDMKNEDFVLII